MEIKIKKTLLILLFSIAFTPVPLNRKLPNGTDESNDLF